MSSATPLPRNVKVLCATSLLNDTASEMIFPLLPKFLLGGAQGNKVLLGVIEGLADSLSSLLRLWSGGRSDQVGRRKGFVLVGYALAVLTRPFIGLVTAVGQLLALRTADRIGKGIRSAPRDALIADSTSPEMRGWAFGVHRAMDHLGATLGPLLAAAFLFFVSDDMRTLFLLTIIPGLIVLVVLIFGLRETPNPTPPAESIQLSLRPFDGNMKRFLAALFLFTLGNSSDAFLLVRAGELGVDTWQLPLLWAGFHVIKSGSNILFGRAVDRHGPRGYLIAGWLLYALVYVLFGLAGSAWQAWALFAAYGVFYGLTEPAEKTMIATLAGKDRKGLAFGWFHFAIGIGTLPASIIFGTLSQHMGNLAAFGLGAWLALLAVLVLWSVRLPAREVKAPA